MKQIIICLILLLPVLGLVACHSTEANYKAAYDKAVNRTRENTGEDKYDHDKAERLRSTEVVNGDSVRLLRTYCDMVDGEAKSMKKFAVIVAEFDQVINARSYRDRIHRKEGFESYVVFLNSTKKYCVVAQGFDTKGEAAAYVQNIGKYMKMKILVPRPWILEHF